MKTINFPSPLKKMKPEGLNNLLERLQRTHPELIERATSCFIGKLSKEIDLFPLHVLESMMHAEASMDNTPRTQKEKIEWMVISIPSSFTPTEWQQANAYSCMSQDYWSAAIRMLVFVHVAKKLNLDNAYGVTKKLLESKEGKNSQLYADISAAISYSYELIIQSLYEAEAAISSGET